MADDLDSDLVPDDDTMHRFLAWWFRRCTRGVIELGWTDERDGKLSLFRRFGLDEIEQAVRFAAETNERPGCSLYFRPATVKADTQYTHDGDVVQIPGIWGDADTVPSCERILSADGIIPSAQIITGRYPALRCQFLWLFSTEPILIAEWSRELNRRVQLLSDSDPAVTNPSTLLRLPGSIAWAWKPGRVPELTEWITPDGGGNSVTVDQLKARLPELATASASTSPKANGATSADDLLNPIRALIERARAGQHWHQTVLELTARLVSRNTPTAVILAMAEHLMTPGYTGHTIAQTRDELAKMIAGARRKGFDGDPGGADSAEADVMDVPVKDETVEPFPASPLELPEPATIPPRKWIYGRLLVAGYVSLVSAPSGVGKTALATGIAISIATNKSILGDRVYCGGAKVLICGLEDPRDELDRRVAAAMLHHQITAEQLRGRLFSVDGRKDRLTIARLHKDGASVVYPDKERIIARIRADAIRVIIVDPFVNSHALPENSNDLINAAVRAWAEVADETDCAVLLIHHTRKGAVAGDPDASRGASALNAAARVHSTLVAMTSDEAQIFGISEAQRRRHIRLDSAKANLTPPGDAQWFRLADVPLGNATPDYPDGDSVQAIEHWQPPAAFAGADMPALVHALDRLNAGPGDGEQYAYRSNAKERWAGHVIMKETDKSEADAKRILKAWKASSLITTEPYDSPARRCEIPGLQVNATLLAQMKQAPKGENEG